MADLWSVVVGGAIAAASGVATQVCVHVIRTREERRNRTIAKFEELVAAVYEHDRWLDFKLNYHTFREGELPGVNPMAKIEALCAIHFPQLVQLASSMNYHAAAFVHWMAKAGQKRLNGESDAMQGYDTAYKPYMESNRALMRAVLEYGHDKFGQWSKSASAKPKPPAGPGGESK
jgi:hypothetical protein